MATDLSLLLRLRSLTPARVRLEGAGTAATLQSVLEFQLAHAQARDAIHTAMDAHRIEAALSPLPVVHVKSCTDDRSTYLRRPDLGRRLSPVSADLLTPQHCDVAFVIADGLSATAVEHHAAAVIKATMPMVQGWTIGPVVIATQARVAIGDEIGERLGAEFVVLLVGERPGLSVSDSLGAYITYRPRSGRQDSERNCISNIHTNGGLTHGQAAAKIAWLLTEARKLGCTGIGLKDEMTDALETGEAPVVIAGS